MAAMAYVLAPSLVARTTGSPGCDRPPRKRIMLGFPVDHHNPQETTLYMYMYLYICKYIYLCIYIYICIYQNTYIHIYIYVHIYNIYIYIHTHIIYICIYIYVYKYIHIHIHIYTFTYIHIYTYIFTYIYIYLYIYIYTHIYINIHIYVHIYIYTTCLFMKSPFNIYADIRATSGFCPGVAAYISTIHKQMILQITVIPMGKITKVLGTIKQTRSKHPKFLWEKQKPHNIWNFYEKNIKGTRKF